MATNEVVLITDNVPKTPERLKRSLSANSSIINTKTNSSVPLRKPLRHNYDDLIGSLLKLSIKIKDSQLQTELEEVINRLSRMNLQDSLSYRKKKSLNTEQRLWLTSTARKGRGKKRKMREMKGIAKNLSAPLEAATLVMDSNLVNETSPIISSTIPLVLSQRIECLPEAKDKPTWSRTAQ